MTRSEILDTAKKCVCGQREQDYGSPESNFQLIADLWNAYLGTHCCSNVDGYACLDDITPKDVAMMMALLKIARIRNGGGTGDSFVDLAGYAACGGELCSDVKNYPAKANVTKTCRTCKYSDESDKFGICRGCIEDDRVTYRNWEAKE